MAWTIYVDGARPELNSCDSNRNRDTIPRRAPDAIDFAPLKHFYARLNITISRRPCVLNYTRR